MRSPIILGKFKDLMIDIIRFFYKKKWDNAR